MERRSDKLKRKERTYAGRGERKSQAEEGENPKEGGAINEAYNCRSLKKEGEENGRRKEQDS